MSVSDVVVVTVGNCEVTVVVVGVDDSESSWDAFWWSCGESQRLGGRIVAVFVSPATGSGMEAVSALSQAIFANSRFAAKPMEQVI